LAGKPPLKAKVEKAADAVRTERAEKNADAVRGFAETMYAAKSWTIKRRVAARIEATPLGLDIRYVVTSIKTGAPEWLYAELYCARGQAENLIKLHKTQLKSDRTSCRSPRANQMRLILHTAAYWLILTVRDAIAKTEALSSIRCAWRSSRSAPALSKRQAACASPSAPLVRTRPCSATLRPHCRPGLKRQGQTPLEPQPFLERVPSVLPSTAMKKAQRASVSSLHAALVL
jgi:hypothetical protein